MKEERRIITILFADVSGFTAMSESLDPEDVRAIMNECFSLLSEAIYKEGGMVDKYIGDNIMALFGVPKAQEDDPVRAIRAALSMQKVLQKFGEDLKKSRGVSVAMRIGLNTGLVVAGDVGSAQKSAFTVMGDAVNLASRIEHHCRPQEVWVSRTTYLAAQDKFEFERQAAIAVKGKTKPQTFYQVLRERQTPILDQGVFAGRAKEMESLQSALKKTLKGSVHLVTASGEAGIGKSRLLHEFIKWAQPRLAAKGGRILKATALPQDPTRYALFAPLCQELNIPLPGQGAREKAEFFLAIEQALLKMVSQSPSIIVLEDAHFADQGSWDLLAFLLNKIRQAPLLLLVLFRPEADKKLLWSSAENYLPMTLKALSSSDSLDLIEKSLGRNRLPKSMKVDIGRKANGNAFFLTQLLRHLMESETLRCDSGVWELAEGYAPTTPESVQGVVLARLDSLSPLSRLLLQVASCEGLEFSPQILEVIEPTLAMATSSLEELVSRQFLEPRPEGAFVFTHTILRETCYESLLKGKRREYHLHLAKFWEERFNQDPQDNNLYRTADHYFECGNPEKAVPFCWKAGHSAERCFDGERALLYYCRVVQLIETAPSKPAQPTMAMANFKLGDMYNWVFSPDEALKCYLDCLKLLAPDDRLRIETYRKIAIVCNVRGEPARTETMLSEAANALGDNPTGASALGLYYEAAMAYFRSGKNEESRAWMDKIIAHYRREKKPLPAPADSDIYSLIPAFSHLTEQWVQQI